MDALGLMMATCEKTTFKGLIRVTQKIGPISVTEQSLILLFTCICVTDWSVQPELPTPAPSLAIRKGNIKEVEVSLLTISANELGERPFTTNFSI